MFLVQASLQETAEGYAIHIDSRAPVATTPASRKRLEQDPSAWRFAAGGGLVILDCADRSVALVRYRDSGAPNYANHWTLGSGVSSSAEELTDLERVVVREACEEFIIATPQGVALPTFSIDRLDQVSYGAVGTSHDARTRLGADSPFATDRYLEVAASFEELPEDKTLSVFLPDEEPATYRGRVYIDPGTRGIDLLKRIRIAIPFRFDELSFLDGEEGPNGESIDSEIGCLPIEASGIGRTLIACWKNGKRTNEYPPFKQLTPLLEMMLT